jgi:hypothetical protein
LDGAAGGGVGGGGYVEWEREKGSGFVGVKLLTAEIAEEVRRDRRDENPGS